jgi:hypothetical protein
MKGELLAAECNGIMVLKWKEKRDISIISFHDSEMVTAKSKGNK